MNHESMIISCMLFFESSSFFVVLLSFTQEVFECLSVWEAAVFSSSLVDYHNEFNAFSSRGSTRPVIEKSLIIEFENIPSEVAHQAEEVTRTKI